MDQASRSGRPFRVVEVEGVEVDSSPFFDRMVKFTSRILTLLAVMAPILGLQYDLSVDVQLILVASLLLGTPALSLIGAIGAALTLGLRSGGVLLALLVLPLYIPVLIFGAGAVEATASGLGGQAHLSMLAAILVGSMVLAPLATAAALRVAED